MQLRTQISFLIMTILLLPNVMHYSCFEASSTAVYECAIFKQYASTIEAPQKVQKKSRYRGLIVVQQG